MCREGEAAVTWRGALNPGRKGICSPQHWKRESWALEMLWEGINSIFRDVAHTAP